MGEFIDKILGDEGIKTDVKVSIAPMAVPILLVTIVVAVTGSILLADVIRKAMK